MPRSIQWLFGLSLVALLIGGPLGWAHYCQKNYRNFHVVRDGALYRSGQLSLHGLKKVIHDYGIRTVITLRDAYHAGDPPPAVAEENFCLLEDINYHRFPLRAWEGPDNTVPAEENVQRFLEIMDNPRNYPVLIHCFAGSHRTGAYCAVYRMEYQQWSNADALDEMKEYGYTNLDEENDILGFLTRYQPRRQKP
jgi:protein tyrosine/serine phosphatase